MGSVDDCGFVGLLTASDTLFDYFPILYSIDSIVIAS